MDEAAHPFPENQGPFPPKEPIEPFIEETEGYQWHKLRPLKAPVDLRTLYSFLEELKWMTDQFASATLVDRHLISSYLHQTQVEVLKSPLKSELLQKFEELIHSFNQLVLHVHASHQEHIKRRIDELQLLIQKELKHSKH